MSEKGEVSKEELDKLKKMQDKTGVKPDTGRTKQKALPDQAPEEPEKEEAPTENAPIQAIPWADEIEQEPIPCDSKGNALAIPENKFQISSLYGVDPTFVIMMGPPGKERPFVTSEGLSVKSEKKGVRSIQSKEVEELRDETGKFLGYQVTAYLWPKISKEEMELLKLIPTFDKDVQGQVLGELLKPYIAVGTATFKNTKMGTMTTYLLELAETRAINRAKRQFTACGLCSVEELSDYEGKEGD